MNEFDPFAVGANLVGALPHHFEVGMFPVAVSLLPVMSATLLSVVVVCFVVVELFSYLAYLYLALLFVRIPVLAALIDIARAL